MRYMICIFPIFFYLVLIHELKSAIQLNLEENEENREPKALQREQRLSSTTCR